MRLIDATAFKQQVATAAVQNGTPEAAHKANIVIDLIDNQPTIHEDTRLDLEEIQLLKRDLEKKVCTGCWLKEGIVASEKIVALRSLLEDALYAIESSYDGFDSELVERIRNVLV